MKSTSPMSVLALIAAIPLVGCDDGHKSMRVVGETSSDRIEITAEFNEPIVELLVAEGETVTKGQLLLRQDASRATARLVEADAARGEAQARLDELVRGPRRESITQARAMVDGAVRELDFRSAEYERMKDVHAKDLASDEQLDRAKARFDAATAELDLHQAQLQELLAGTTAEALEQAERALQQAQARRDYLQIDVDRHELRAPMDGIADSRMFEIGERPGIGQAVMTMLGGEQVHARVYIPERLRLRAQPGVGTRIYVDGLDEPLSGRVRWVSSESAFTPYFALTERDRGHLSYVAKIDIVDARERLPDGVPVEVELLTERAMVEGALEMGTLE